MYIFLCSCGFGLCSVYYFSIGVFVFCVFTVYVTLDTSAGTLECHTGFWIAHGSDDVAGAHPAPTSPLRRQVVQHTNQVQPLYVTDDWCTETGHRVWGVRICVSHLLCRESATGLSRTAWSKWVTIFISSFVFFVDDNFFRLKHDLKERDCHQ